MKKIFTVKTIVVSALLTSLSVILRLLGFPQSGVFRIELGFLPIAESGYLFGGLTAGIIYLVADILGTLITGMPPFFPISLCKLLTGVLYGVFFGRYGKSFKNIIICTAVTTVFVDLIFMTIALIPISGGKTFFAILTARLIAAAVNVPLKIVSLYIMFKYINFDKLKAR